MATHPLAHVFWGRLMDGARRAPRGTVILLSGGVDSQAVLRALVESHKQPEALTFYAGTEPSRDVMLAVRAAAALDVPIRVLRLETDPEYLRQYVHGAVEFGLRGKAAIECFYPRREAMDVLVNQGAPGLATGDGGDGYFGLSKKAMIHVRPGGAPAMDEFRAWYFGRPDWSQTASIRRYAEERGLAVSMPLADSRLLDACRGWDWEGLNRPRQKQPIRDSFPGLDELPPHQNLQLGDSGIADAFRALTPAGRKSPVAYYNQVTACREAREAREMGAEAAHQEETLRAAQAAQGMLW